MNTTGFAGGCSLRPGRESTPVCGSSLRLLSRLMRSAVLVAFATAVMGFSAPRGMAQPDESVLSDPWVIEHVSAGLHDLYEMRYDRADSIFSVAEQRYPRHPLGPFLRSLVVWWKILPSLSVHDTSYDEDFLRLMDQVEKRSDRMLRDDRDSFDGHFFMGAAYGFRGRLYSDRKRWLKAAQDGRRALDHVFEVAEYEESTADAVFGVGVYDYFAAAIPERYSIVRPLMFFFPDANKQRGLERLERVVSEGRYIQTEAAWFLLQIHLVFDPNFEESLRYVQWLRHYHPQNALFHVMEGRVYVKWGQWARARERFEEVVDARALGRPGYVAPLVAQAHYFIGRDDMRRGDYMLARDHFRRVESLEDRYETPSYARIHAALRSGMIHDLLDEREQALRHYRRVLDWPEEGSSHSRAERYVNEPYFIE